jgi:ABC-type lipoprotein export system ATPase subunit
MTIGLYNVTPAPLAGVINLSTDIWQKECVFESGRRYRVVAPSGKGKSTFIHCMYGLRYDYEGKVMLADRDTKSIDPDQWAELRQHDLSIVYQDLRLFLHLTARQNLQVKTALYSGDFQEKINYMAGLLGVTPLLDKKCQTLSYGERQRVAIIRALIQPFRWLLLDEPFSHLDKANITQAASLIDAEVNARKAGVILTSLGQDDFFGFDKQLQL